MEEDRFTCDTPDGHVPFFGSFVGADEPDEPGEKSAKTEKQETAEDLIRMQEGFLRNHQDVFEQISKSSQIVMQPGKGFRIIYGKPPVIELDAQDWKKMKEGEFTEEEMIFSTMHEIAHFLDMMDDPEAMGANFDYIAKKAKNSVSKVRWVWQEALSKKGQTLPAFVTDGYLENFIYKQLHGFYNCLDDVYVNNMVAVKLPFRYSERSGSEFGTISKLYANHLFKTTDYTGRSKSKQLGYAVLRRHMAKGSYAEFSPEVDMVLDKQVSVGGKKSTIRSLLDSVLTPSSKLIPKEKQNLPGHRYQFIQGYLEPFFWELFMEDIKNFPPPKKNEKKEKNDDENEGEDGEDGEGGGGDTEMPPDVGDDQNDEDGGEDGEDSDADESEGSEGKKGKQNKPDEKKDTGEGESGEGDSQGDEDGDDKSEGDESKDGKAGKGKKPDDKEDGADDENGEGGEANDDDNPWKDEGETGPVNKGIIDDFLKSKAEYEEANKPLEIEKQETLSPEEAIRQRNIKYDANLAEKYGKLSPEQALDAARQWQEYYETIKPYIDELTEVFDMILNTINAQISEAWQEGFKSGRLNIPYFIEKYGTTLAAGVVDENINKFVDFSELDIHDQKEFTSRLKIYPNNIVFRIMMDNSQSMTQAIKDGEKSFPKILSAKRLMVLLYEALGSFQDRVNHNFRLNEPFVVDIEVQTFGDKTTLAKPLGYYGEEERGLMIASLAYLTASEGNTLDNQVWENAAAQLANDPERIEEIKKCEAQDMALEVTDGDSWSADATIPAVKDYIDLAGKGSANGIKIVGTEETPENYKKSTFNKIFKGNGRPVRDTAEFSQAMVDLLSIKFQAMQQVIRVKQEESDNFDPEDD